MPRFALVIFLVSSLICRLSAQTPFTPDPDDSPQLLAFVQGNPIPVPEADGGGVIEIGKTVPPSFPLKPVAGTSWFAGSFELPAPYETVSGNRFVVLTQGETSPVTAIITGGHRPQMLFENNRVVGKAPAGTLVLNGSKEPDDITTVMETDFPQLFMLKGDYFDGYLRLAPDLRSASDFTLGGENAFTLSLDNSARQWAAAQKARIATVWSAPAGVDWKSLARIQKEATRRLGDETAALDVILTPALELWSSFEVSNSDGKDLAKDVLRRFAKGAKENGWDFDTFQAAWKLSQAYPAERPASSVVENLLSQFDKMDVRLLLERDSGGSELLSLKALGMATKVDSPEATSDNLSELRWRVADVVKNDAVVASIVPAPSTFWAARRAEESRAQLYARIVRVIRGKFTLLKEESLRWHTDVLLDNSKSPVLKKMAADLLRSLPDEDLIPPGVVDHDRLPLLSLASFLFDYDQREKFTPNEMAAKLDTLLYHLKRQPISEPLQKALPGKIQSEYLSITLRKYAEGPDYDVLRTTFLDYLSRQETARAKRGDYATAASLAVNQAQILKIPEPASPVSILHLPKELPENPWERARYYLGKFMPEAYPLLEGNLPETKELHAVLTHSVEMSFNPARQLLKITPGTVEEFVQATLQARGSGAQPLRLVAQSQRFGPANQEPETPWTGYEHPLLASRMNDLRSARSDVDNIGKPQGWAASFYGTSESEKELEAVRAQLAQARGTASGYQSNVDMAARGVEDYEREKARLQRDGVVVGQDMNRPDRVYTRELNSFENRAIDSTIDNQKETLRRESAYQNALNSDVAQLEAREHELEQEIAHRKGLANNTDRDYVNASRRSLVEAERALKAALEEIGSRPEKGAAAIRFEKRFKALMNYRNQLWSGLDSVEKDRQPELYWRRWWLSRVVTYRRENDYNKGGASLPVYTTSIDDARAAWNYQMDKAFEADENELSGELFVHGAIAISATGENRKELEAELASGCTRLKAKSPHAVYYALRKAADLHDGDVYNLLKERLE